MSEDEAGSDFLREIARSLNVSDTDEREKQCLQALSQAKNVSPKELSIALRMMIPQALRNHKPGSPPRHTKLQQTIWETAEQCIADPYDRQQTQDLLLSQSAYSSLKPIPNANIKYIDVDLPTFRALIISQAVWGLTRSEIEYGSWNQKTESKKTRLGRSTQGQAFTRTSALREAKSSIMQSFVPDANANNVERKSQYEEQAHIVRSASSRYYRAGCCDEHAARAFTNLALIGYPGLLIKHVASIKFNHRFVLVFWKENGEWCKDPVVCDPWVEKHSSLWSQHMVNRDSKPGLVEKRQLEDDPTSIALGSVCEKLGCNSFWLTQREDGEYCIKPMGASIVGRNEKTSKEVLSSDPKIKDIPFLKESLNLRTREKYRTTRVHYICSNDPLSESELDALRQRTTGEEIPFAGKITAQKMGADMEAETLANVGEVILNEVLQRESTILPPSEETLKSHEKYVYDLRSILQEKQAFVEYRYEVGAGSGRYEYLSAFTKPVADTEVNSDGDRNPFTWAPDPLIVEKSRGPGLSTNTQRLDTPPRDIEMAIARWEAERFNSSDTIIRATVDDPNADAASLLWAAKHPNSSDVTLRTIVDHPEVDAVALSWAAKHTNSSDVTLRTIVDHPEADAAALSWIPIHEHSSDATIRAAVNHPQAYDVVLNGATRNPKSSDTTIRAAVNHLKANSVSLYGALRNGNSSEATRVQAQAILALIETVRSSTSDAAIMAAIRDPRANLEVLSEATCNSHSSDATIRAAVDRPEADEMVLHGAITNENSSDETRIQARAILALIETARNSTRDAAIMAAIRDPKANITVLACAVWNRNSSDAAVRAAVDHPEADNTVLGEAIKNRKSSDTTRSRARAIRILMDTTQNSTNDAAIMAAIRDPMANVAVLSGAASNPDSSNATIRVAVDHPKATTHTRSKAIENTNISYQTLSHIGKMEPPKTDNAKRVNQLKSKKFGTRIALLRNNLRFSHGDEKEQRREEIKDAALKNRDRFPGFTR